jgi:GNAT superfamily N-acetyltransferase
VTTEVVDDAVSAEGLGVRLSQAADWPAVAAFLSRRRELMGRSVYYADDTLPNVEIAGSRLHPARTFLAERPGRGSQPPVVVGLSSWRALDAPGLAEGLLLLDGGWAARGLGPRLLDVATEDARRWGIRALVVPVLPLNAGLRAAARELGLPERRRTTGGCDEVEILLAPPGPQQG